MAAPGKNHLGDLGVIDLLLTHARAFATVAPAIRQVSYAASSTAGTKLLTNDRGRGIIVYVRALITGTTDALTMFLSVRDAQFCVSGRAEIAASSAYMPQTAGSVVIETTVFVPGGKTLYANSDAPSGTPTFFFVELDPRAVARALDVEED